MKESKSRNHHGKLPTGWLALTLFFGLLAFFGDLSITVPQQKESQKTEQVVSGKTNAKRAASYARAFVHFHQGNRCAFRQSEFHLLACFHKLVFKTRIDQNSRQVSSLQKPALFFQRKTMPRNSDEDLFNSIRG